MCSRGEGPSADRALEEQVEMPEWQNEASAWGREGTLEIKHSSNHEEEPGATSTVQHVSTNSPVRHLLVQVSADVNTFGVSVNYSIAQGKVRTQELTYKKLRICITCSNLLLLRCLERQTENLDANTNVFDSYCTRAPPPAGCKT